MTCLYNHFVIDYISQNQGIPDAEIVLIVESWLESVRGRVKQSLFGKPTYDDQGEDKP